jgi:hypothetical protein
MSIPRADLEKTASKDQAACCSRGSYIDAVLLTSLSDIWNAHYVGWQLLFGVWDPLHTHVFISVLETIAIIGTSDWPRLAKAC